MTNVQNRNKNCHFQVAYEETPIIEALHKFVNKRVSALPIVDKEVELYNFDFTFK